MKSLDLTLDRAAPTALVEQIRVRIADAILDGSLPGGARLPSWRDLAVQLGVARGTVRAAYEALADAQLVTAAGARGTSVSRDVANVPPPPAVEATPDTAFPYFAVAPLAGQIGVPSHDGFPARLWNRVLRAACREGGAGTGYPDPCGEWRFRERIAAQLALGRGLSCSPGQVIVTSGYASGLALVLRALGLAGRRAWVEEPGYPVTRASLVLAGLSPVPVPVDGQGLDVGQGRRLADDAGLAVVTPGQQAPLGMTLSAARRNELLAWAAERGGWIVEDDYMSELQPDGRAAPALASRDGGGRVIHVGTFSKTMAPGLRLGFLVAPPLLVGRIADLCALTAPAPPPPMQHAMAEFMRAGHYARHLRRMKVRYRRASGMLCDIAREVGVECGGAGLAVRLPFPDEADDVALALEARVLGVAPGALSQWYGSAHARSGLLVGVTNFDRPEAVLAYRELLTTIVATHGDADRRTAGKTSDARRGG